MSTKSDRKPTAGIILAAGMSTRLGRPKQLIRAGDDLLLGRVVQAALDSDLEQVVLVLGHMAETIREKLSPRQLDHPKLRVELNPRYKEGMSSSLQTGLRAVERQFPSIMVILGDMPLVQSDTINYLLNCFRGSNKLICAPVYQGKRGLPVCFSKGMYQSLKGVTGDIGAREVIRKNNNATLFVQMDRADILFDVNRESDVKTLLMKLVSPDEQ